QGVSVDYEHCLHCQRCQRSAPAMNWDASYEWAALSDTSSAAHLDNVFRRSLHVRFVDAGACGACLAEARLLDNPQYNLHRLGIFITPTPRNADVLLVAGPVTENMRAALVNTYEAMPTPKRVVAMGVCALNGGVFSQSFATLGGAAAVIPVDVVIPGCPPPPLAILHGLLLAVGRVTPTPLHADPESAS
ncbi:MAG: NADH-quinone oxidoreductase subunit B family protein, partial [Thermoleophilia bacterium]